MEVEVTVVLVLVTVVDVVLAVVPGDAAACAGTITECTTGRVQDFGKIAKAAAAPTLVPIAFKSGRRFNSSFISSVPTPYHQVSSKVPPKTGIDIIKSNDNITVAAIPGQRQER